MRAMAFYGKGGIGKSTVVTNLSLLFAARGKSVLQFGCDPKADSCYSLVPGPVVTVMDEWLARGEDKLRLNHCLMRTSYGVDCIEVGGPTPGTGCGGRGITKAFELVGDPEDLQKRYDLILFDVLGDVVCGGFSAPMRSGYAQEVFLVTSGEIRSLYAANNISQAIKRHSRGNVKLAGIIANLRGNPQEQDRVERFATEIGSRVLHSIPKDPRVVQAEESRRPLMEFDPACPAAMAFEELCARIEGLVDEDLHVPRPLGRQEFDELFARTGPGE